MSRAEVERVRLGDVASLFIDGDWIESKDQSESGFRLVQTGNIGIGEYLDKKERAKYISADTFSRLKCTEIFAGDILVSRLPDPIGRACILPKMEQRAITAVDCSIIRLDSLKCNSGYFVHFTRSKEYEQQLSRFLAGSTRVRISRKNLQSVQIPLLPLSDQKRIAGELDRICELKRNAEARLQKLDLLVKAKFSEMFGDIVANDKGWEIVGFDNVAIIEGGLTNDFKKYSQFPHIGIDSIEKDTGILRGYRTVEEDNVVSGKYFFTPQHIIYSKIRPNLNKVALPTFEGLCSADAYAILPKDNIDRIYLAYILRSQYFLNYIVPLSGRTGMPKANQKQVRGFKLPLPPLPLQREFADFVEKVEGLKGVAKEELEKVDLLYRARLQEYFG